MTTVTVIDANFVVDSSQILNFRSGGSSIFKRTNFTWNPKFGWKQKIQNTYSGGIVLYQRKCFIKTNVNALADTIAAVWSNQQCMTCIHFDNCHKFVEHCTRTEPYWHSTPQRWDGIHFVHIARPELQKYVMFVVCRNFIEQGGVKDENIQMPKYVRNSVKTKNKSRGQWWYYVCSLVRTLIFNLLLH